MRFYEITTNPGITAYISSEAIVFVAYLPPKDNEHTAAVSMIAGAHAQQITSAPIRRELFSEMLNDENFLKVFIDKDEMYFINLRYICSIMGENGGTRLYFNNCIMPERPKDAKVCGRAHRDYIELPMDVATIIDCIHNHKNVTNYPRIVNPQPEKEQEPGPVTEGFLGRV